GGADTTAAQVVRIMLGAACGAVPIEVSVAPELARSLPADARPARAGRPGLGDTGPADGAAPPTGPGTADGVPPAEVPARLSHVWRVETTEEFARRIESHDLTGRVRVLGEQEVTRLVSAAGAEWADATLLTGPVLTSGRRELLVFLREQAVSRTLHRFGHLSSTPEQSPPTEQPPPAAQA